MGIGKLGVGVTRDVADLNEACGPEPSGPCEWFFDRTGSETWTKFLDWAVARPFRIACVLVGAWLVNRLIRRAIDKFIERQAREQRSLSRVDPERSRQRLLTLGSLLKSFAAVTVYLVALLVVLGEVHINLGPLIAGAGIAGIALGFGAQSLVRDVLAGMFIVVEDQYGVGDLVNLGDASGTVEKVTLRSTSLRDNEGVLWIVPNGEIKRVANRSQRWAKAVVDVRVAYDTDVDQALDVLRQVGLDLETGAAGSGRLLAAPEVEGIESFGEGTMVLRISVRTEPHQQFAVARDLRVRVKSAFDAAGIRGLAGPATIAKTPGPT